MRYVLLFFLFLPKFAWAFPEMSRHGYVNCTACHLSPTGSGLLTEYGRELSKEILSTWSHEGEQKFAYGLVTPPEAVLISAYVRGLQLHRETATAKDGRPILMQADIEAAYNGQKLALTATAGRQEYRVGTKTEERFFSRRHYLLWRATEQQAVRAGRYSAFYGLNDPNHNLYVRRDLGFGQDTESYNLEYSLLGENVSLYLTGLFGNFGDNKSINQETGVSVSASYFFLEKNKIGFSAQHSENETTKRLVGGIWAIIAWSSKLFSLSEIDLQEKKTSAATTVGHVTSNKLQYEITKGVLPYLLFERSYLDRDNPTSLKTGYGIGFQFFPRPHFEFLAQWEKEKLNNVERSDSDTIWIMGNFYL